MEAEVLESEAMKLPELERAILVDRLQESLSSSAISHIGEHLEEAKKRFEAYKSGDIEALDGDSVVNSILAKIGGEST